jgi:hypothetical protein
MRSNKFQDRLRQRYRQDDDEEALNRVLDKRGGQRERRLRPIVLTVIFALGVGFLTYWLLAH